MNHKPGTIVEHLKNSFPKRIIIKDIRNNEDTATYLVYIPKDRNIEMNNSILDDPRHWAKTGTVKESEVELIELLYG